MENIKIGRIVNAVALHGEVKVYNYSGSRERYNDLKSIIIDGREYEIEKVRFQQESVILKLAGVDDRTMAEKMKNKDIYITEEDLPQLPEGTYYIKDLIGIKVYDVETGSEIGVIKDVLQNTAQDIYQIEKPDGGECLIPVVSQFVKSVNIRAGRVEVKLIEGMSE